jgi:RNA polymerase sigma-70 factor (ECF subfamily)
LDQAIGNERRERYEWALARLSQGDREAIIARFEFGFSGLELAAALHKPTADAARMAVTRAVVRLTRTLGQAPPSPRGSTTPTLT